MIQTTSLSLSLFLFFSIYKWILMIRKYWQYQYRIFSTTDALSSSSKLFWLSGQSKMWLVWVHTEMCWWWYHWSLWWNRMSTISLHWMPQYLLSFDSLEWTVTHFFLCSNAFVVCLFVSFLSQIWVFRSWITSSRRSWVSCCLSISSLSLFTIPVASVLGSD
jgi:hypothetical protein